MELPKYFISCDWGTTNFRLRVVKTDTLQVIAEQSSDQGIKSLYDKFLNGKSGEKLPQKEFFCRYLAQSIEQLPKSHQDHLIVISGMASSNMGMMELDYSEFPFDETGKNLNWKIISFRKDQDILLISGVKDSKGMMRGEEIQAIGLAQQLKAYEEGILILPGTHSKHLQLKAGSFVDLENYMTGEIFELLCKKSILKNSIEFSNWDKSRMRAFTKGLSVGVSKKISSNLFSIRAFHLNGKTSKQDNYYFLSGMLIGEELAYLRDSKGFIFLMASEPVFSLYKTALEEIINADRIVFFGDKSLEKTLIIGHKQILQNYVG